MFAFTQLYDVLPYFCRVVFGPERMITIAPRHYCVIENPVQRKENGEVIMDHGQAKLLHADQEIRLAQVSNPLKSRGV